MKEDATDHPSAAPRYLVPDHLGRLGRWLRAAGIDAQDTRLTGEALLRLAREEGRIALTRSAALAASAAEATLHIGPADLHPQLVLVLRASGIDPRAASFTRCLQCNVPLGDVEEAAVADALPPRVRGQHLRLRRCPSCCRVFWSGSHVARIERGLLAAFDDARRGT